VAASLIFGAPLALALGLGVGVGLGVADASAEGVSLGAASDGTASGAAVAVVVVTDSVVAWLVGWLSLEPHAATARASEAARAKREIIVVRPSAGVRPRSYRGARDAQEGIT
jgi:hypothetical protein